MLPKHMRRRLKVNQTTGQKECSTLYIFNQTDTLTDSLLGFQNSSAWFMVHGENSSVWWIMIRCQQTKQGDYVEN